MFAPVFGLHFGELFVIAFVFLTVVGAPYAARIGERIALLIAGEKTTSPKVEPELPNTQEQKHRDEESRE